MQPGAETNIILLSVFAIVFLISFYVQMRIQQRRVLDSAEVSVSRIGRLIDWLIIIAVTSLLVYLVK